MLIIKRLACFLLLGFIAMAVFAGGRQDGSSAVDNYPSRPIRLVLGVAPGGAMETAARMWQPFLERELGVPIVIDCIPGAEGMIAGRIAAEAAPDGYTLIQMPMSFLSIQTLILNAPYEYEDFEILVNYISDPKMFMVHKDSPWNTLREMIDYAKSQPPESFTFGLTTITEEDVIILRTLEAIEGVRFNLVPFGGGNPARMALAGRHVDAMCHNFFGGQSIWEYIRVLAVAQDENL